MNWILVALAAYLGAQVLIGVWLAPKIHTEDDYLVGGRQLGYPLATFSFFATWFGAETCISSAGRAYAEGFSLTSAEPFAYGLTLVLCGLIFAVPFWRLKLTTMADFFLRRYGVRVERLAALLLIPTGILWSAAQLRGFGHVLTTLTEVDIATATVVAGGFCVVYTVLGGMLADAITDLIQGIVLIVGICLLAGAVIVYHGSIGATMAAIDPARITLVPPDVSPTFFSLLEEYAIPIGGSVVAVELISRAISTRTPAIARNSAVIAGGLYIAVGALPVMLGLLAPTLVGSLDDAEQVLPILAQRMLPTAGYVVFLGALISAILSTVNTILLVAGGLLAHNLIAPMWGVTDEARKLRLARYGVFGFGLLSLYLALGGRNVAELVEESSSFGTAGMLVVVSFGLFSTFGGSRAAVLTLVGGLVSYAVGSAVDVPYPFLTSLSVSIVLYVAAGMFERTSSRLTRGVKA